MHDTDQLIGYVSPPKAEMTAIAELQVDVFFTPVLVIAVLGVRCSYLTPLTWTF